MSTEYQPGACNIGPAERRVRYGVGAVGFASTVALALAVPVLSWPRWVLLLTAVPLFGGFLGLYQGRTRFCVRYAMEGVYNVSDRLGDAEAVPDAAAARRDRRYALSVVVRSALAALLLASALFLLVPVVAAA